MVTDQNHSSVDTAASSRDDSDKLLGEREPAVRSIVSRKSSRSAREDAASAKDGNQGEHYEHETAPSRRLRRHHFE
jgi:hypothetical protein